jgi:hypothetical protein
MTLSQKFAYLATGLLTTYASVLLYRSVICEERMRLWNTFRRPLRSEPQDLRSWTRPHTHAASQQASDG